MPNLDKPGLSLKVIPWLTQWIWQHTPCAKAKCRGCGTPIPYKTPAFMYVYGFYHGYAQQGYLCPECGQTALRAIIEEATKLLPKEEEGDA